MSLTELFCDVDDFWQSFEPGWKQERLASGERQRTRAGQLCESEIMTLLIHFHQARYRDFKTYYVDYVQRHLQREFPQLVSYSRFVQLIPRVLVPLCAYLHTCYGECRGISFVDSTALAVCHNRRIPQHRVFEGVAARGRTSVDWFLASSCIWWSTSVENSSRAVSHPEMWTTVNRLSNSPNGSLASCLGTKAISHHPCPCQHEIPADGCRR